MSTRSKRRLAKKQQIANSQVLPRTTPIDLQNHIQLVHQQREEYSGSLPHPDHLERFEALCPGITNRLMMTIEIEQRDANAAKNRQLELHAMGLQAHIADNKRSDYLAVIALIACLGAAVACVYLGAPKVGGVIGGTTTMGVVGSILYGRLKALRRGQSKTEPKPAKK